MLFQINSLIKLSGVHFEIKIGTNTLIKKGSVEVIINENQHYKTTEYLGALSCQATLETDVDEEVEEILIAISSGSTGERLCGKLFDTLCKVYITPKGKEILIGHRGCFGTSGCLTVNLKSYIDEIDSKIKNSVKELFDVLSWRCGQDGLVSHGELRWSKDSKNWHPVPQTYNISDMEITGIKIFEDCQIEEAIKVLNFSGGAPLYHELFREAWSFRKNHPKVALVTGISAVEVAMRQCIRDFAPGANWWFNIRSTTPKFDDMLEKFLPNLLDIKNGILVSDDKGNVKVLIPSQLKKILIKVNEHRNKLVHCKDGSNHDFEVKVDGKSLSVQEMLISIKDLIWLIDYYRGYDWAYDYLSQDVQKEISKAKMKQA